MNIESPNFFTPNVQLLIEVGVALFIVVAFAVFFLLIYRKQIEIVNSFGKAKPLWQHIRAEAATFLRHPHDWALEKDALMDEAELEPEVPMKEDRYQRLMTILADMVNNPQHKEGMREGERDYAALMLIALPKARKEATLRTELGNVRLVGSHAPVPQTAQDAAKSERASQ